MNQTREMLLMEPWLTNVKPEELPKPFVKWSYEPKRAEDVPGAFMRAFAMALQEPSGPVFLSIPLDDWSKPFNGDTLKRSIDSKFGADPDLAAKAPVGDTLLSNATYAIKQLLPLVTTHKKDLTLKKTTHNMASHPISQVSETTANMLNALDVFKVIRDTVPKHTILVEETPSNLADLHSVWPITAHDEFYTFASGSLGWGTPAAVGIALGEKTNGGNRPVVAIVGDGSFQYAIQGIWTANQHDLPIIYVIPVNKEYGILKSFSKAQQTPNVPGLDIPDLDITSLGKGYGYQSVEATTLNDVKEAVKLALDSKKQQS
ncbi:thiamine pyrophosphate-dependent enzyme [Vagococcus jeotgali]|uniref:thiamine pyrophosphate-dependent enzyme n=1 Tax=Vagococcus jeotgali TaxID=3109030 RepID=UPI002DD8423C|nr:thiamine pyrophosphate-dependent enzyme [Vagococcus sp. B2T-5]